MDSFHRSFFSYSNSQRSQKKQNASQNCGSENSSGLGIKDTQEQVSVFPNLPGSAFPPTLNKTNINTLQNKNSARLVSPSQNNFDYVNVNVSNQTDYSESPPTTVAPENEVADSPIHNLDFDTNVSANDPNQEESAQEETDDLHPESPTSKTDKSVKSDTPKPRSCSPYEKHIVDIPKPKRVCAGVKTFSTTQEPSELPKSCVYVTRPPGYVYQLEFYTKNVQFSPLYLSPRPMPIAVTEKKVQPIVYEYREQSPPPDPTKTNMVSLVRKQYAVSMDDHVPPKSKSILPPLRVYTDDVASNKRRSRSEAGKSSPLGSVYISYEGVLLRILCKHMPITQVKMPVPEDILARMEKLKMPSSDSRKNKGVMIARCGQDLLQFTFDMDQVTFNKIELKGSAAVQTEDKMVYIRERSQISGRPLLLALPETTYFYKNPMDQIHRLHLNFQGTNVMPLWKYKLMRARLAERRGATAVEAKIDQAFKQTRGSRLCFDGLDSIITVQGGMMCCEVPSGQSKYENLIESRSHYQPPPRAQRSAPPKARTVEEPDDGTKAEEISEKSGEATNEPEQAEEEKAET